MPAHFFFTVNKDTVQCQISLGGQDTMTEAKLHLSKKWQGKEENLRERRLSMTRTHNL